MPYYLVCKACLNKHFAGEEKTCTHAINFFTGKRIEDKCHMCGLFDKLHCTGNGYPNEPR